jgi:ribA/ribD-fused uncharacterized protein
MFKAVLCKFQTHEDLRAILLATGEEEIVEKTTHDYYWGCGTEGTGKNMLGITLVRVRDVLREQTNV